MTCLDIQRSLIVERYRRHFVVPNYTPAQWFECDVFELTDAGFFREYEIKISRADFKADAAKYARRGYGFDRTKENKHESLAARAVTGPTRFWFVCPEGLLTAEEIPEWSGLIYAREKPGHRTPWNVLLNEVKAAPPLHREKSDQKIRMHAESVFYYRFHQLLLYRRLDGDPEEKSPAQMEVIAYPGEQRLVM